MEIFDYTRGSSPFLMSIPHVGEYIPEDILAQLNEVGSRITDTDWYLDRLYNFSGELGIHILKANYSRYVIDLNRSPDNKSLYPGQDVTELVPTSTFAQEPLYAKETMPNEGEIDRRRAKYWQPYHNKLSAILSNIKSEHGYVVLFENHSIKSVVPRFFEGKLSDFNLGTSGGESCATNLREALVNALSENDRYTLAVDERFKGGYITRKYGIPSDNIHSFQLELSIATYMEEVPELVWREDLADQVRPSLKAMMKAAIITNF